MKKIIHINKHVIASNRKHGRNEPPITIKTYKYNIKAHEVKILGPCEIKHSPHKPLKCGARVWIETEADIEAMFDGAAS